MTRLSVRQKKRYELNMNRAIQCYKTGATYCNAAARSGVNHATLYRRVNTPFSKLGRRTALSKQEEEVIVQFLLRYAQRGVPLTMMHLADAIKIVVGTMTPARRILLPFRHGAPGRSYLRNFRERHKDKLAFARPLGQESKRMAANNGEVLSTHLAVLTKLINDNSLDETRIFNLDECGSTPQKDLNSNVSCRRFLPKRGSRDYQVNKFAYLKRITMMPVISASGKAGPALFVFKGSKIPYRTVLQEGVATTKTSACKLPRGSTLALREQNGGGGEGRFPERHKLGM